MPLLISFKASNNTTCSIVPLDIKLEQAKKIRDIKSGDVWKAKRVRFHQGVKPGIKTNDFLVEFMHFDRESYTTQLN